MNSYFFLFLKWNECPTWVPEARAVRMLRHDWFQTTSLMLFFIFINQESLKEGNCAVKEFMSPPLLFSLFVHPPKYVLIIWFSIFCARPPTTLEITNAQRKSRKEYWREGNCAVKGVCLSLSLQYSNLISSHIISFGLLVHPPDWIKTSTWFSSFSWFSLPLYSSQVNSLYAQLLL